MLILTLGLSLPLTSCKSKKKQAEEQARLEAQAKENQRKEYLAQLDKLMQSPISDMDEWERKYKSFQDLVFNNPFKGEIAVEGKIAKVEAFFQSEKKRLQEESVSNETNDYEDPNQELKAELTRTFRDIAGAPSYEEANLLIGQLLTKFESAESPVLVVISQAGEEKDYDRPTTAEKLLNYLKDKKQNPYSISDILLNSSGKIRSMELLLSK